MRLRPGDTGSSLGLPPAFSGAAACGWPSVRNRRCAARARSSERPACGLGGTRGGEHNCDGGVRCACWASNASERTVACRRDELGRSGVRVTAVSGRCGRRSTPEDARPAGTDCG